MILITGASGLLGSNLSYVCSRRDVPFQGTYWSHTMADPRGFFSRRDLRVKSDVTSLFSEVKPDVVINCSAFTNVDQAERSSKEALTVNADVPEFLAAESKRRNIQFIHISTDGVFNGHGTPLTERDPPGPVNVYAESKLIGERRVLAVYSSALIIRTCIYGWSCMGRESLAEWILKQLFEGLPLSAFVDVSFNPLYVGTLSCLILELAHLRVTGVINLGSCDEMTKFEFARALADEFELDAELIKRGKISDLSLVARRPHYTVLDCCRAETLLGRTMPTLIMGIRAMHRFREKGMLQQMKEWAS